MAAVNPTTDPTVRPVDPQPPVWDPHCPGCLSGFGPIPGDPNDPVVKISQPASVAS